MSLLVFVYLQIEIGLLLGNSQVTFEKSETSSVNLVGECYKHTNFLQKWLFFFPNEKGESQRTSSRY